MTLYTSVHTAYDNLPIYTIIIQSFTKDIYNIYTRKKALRQCKPLPGRHLEFCRMAQFVSKVAYLCRIAKFGEDILNHSRTIASGKFSARRFWPWTLTLTSQQLIMTFSTGAGYPWQISWKSDFNFSRNHSNGHVNELTYKQTNKLTNRHDWWQYLLAEITSNQSTSVLQTRQTINQFSVVDDRQVTKTDLIHCCHVMLIKGLCKIF